MKNNLRKVGKSLLKLDLFGEQIGLNIDGEGANKTILGLLFSLCIFATIIPYGVKKYDVMINYEDTDIQRTVDSNGLAIDEVV